MTLADSFAPGSYTFGALAAIANVIERTCAPDWIEKFIKWNGGRLEEPTAEDLSASGSQTRAPTVERVATRGRGQTQHPSTKAEGTRATGARESSANAQ